MSCESPCRVQATKRDLSGPPYLFLHSHRTESSASLFRFFSQNGFTRLFLFHSSSHVAALFCAKKKFTCNTPFFLLLFCFFSLHSTEGKKKKKKKRAISEACMPQFRGQRHGRHLLTCCPPFLYAIRPGSSSSLFFAPEQAFP